MKRLVFANIDYEPVGGAGGHMTDEGMQLQRGLEHAGWTLVGSGFGNGCRNVPELIEKNQPDIVFVQDKRDWDPASGGCFRKNIGFQNLGFLAKCNSIFKVCVVKDAGSLIDYHREFCDEIQADAVVVYYHPQSVTRLSPWLSRHRLIRTYHSVDKKVADSIPFSVNRKKGVVSGARSGVYPLRELIFRSYRQLGIDTIKHPGYNNKGHATAQYLSVIGRYAVHIATASAYGFALRKIIESVAMGCTPITDLPSYDILPEIDQALVRVAPPYDVLKLGATINRAAVSWSAQERRVFASAARDFYDWRAIGLRLSNLIVEARQEKICATNN